MLVTAKTTTPKYFYIIIMQFLHYFQSASFGMPAITAFWKLQNAMFQVCIWTWMHERLKSYFSLKKINKVIDVEKQGWGNAGCLNNVQG